MAKLGQASGPLRPPASIHKAVLLANNATDCGATLVTVYLQNTLQGRFCAAKRGKYLMLHPHAGKLTDKYAIVKRQY